MSSNNNESLFKNSVRNFDEYRSLAYGSSSFFRTDGTLVTSLSSEKNIISLWFAYLSLNEKVSEHFLRDGLFLGSHSLAYGAFNTFFDVVKVFFGADGSPQTSVKLDGDTVLLYSPQAYEYLNDNADENNSENDIFSYKIDEAVSNFLICKNYIEKVKFVDLKVKQEETKVFHFVVIGDNANFNGYNSKFILKILSSSVRWAKPHLIEPYSEKEINFLSKLSEVISRDNNTSIDFSDDIFGEFANLLSDSITPHLSEAKREKLLSFAKLSINNTINQCKNDIQYFENNIRDYESFLKDSYAKRNELVHKLAYYNLRQDEPDEEFISFVDLLYEKCSNIKISTNEVEFYHSSLMSYINGGDFIDDYIKSSHLNEDMILLLKALFVDRIVDMRMFSAYYINFNSNSVDTFLKDVYTGEYVENALPNPHHKAFNCIGDNKSKLIESASKGDYYSVLIRLMYMTGSINLEEEPTLNHLIQYLKQYLNGEFNYKRCFVFKEDDKEDDNNYMSAQEVLKRLKESSE